MEQLLDEPRKLVETNPWTQATSVELEGKATTMGSLRFLNEVQIPHYSRHIADNQVVISSTNYNF